MFTYQRVFIINENQAKAKIVRNSLEDISISGEIGRIGYYSLSTGTRFNGSKCKLIEIY